MGPFTAALTERIGIRRTMAVAMALARGARSSSRPACAQPWQLVVLWGLLVGIGSGMAATVLGAAVVTRWFHARRGSSWARSPPAPPPGSSSSCRCSRASSRTTAGARRSGSSPARRCSWCRSPSRRARVAGRRRAPPLRRDRGRPAAPRRGNPVAVAFATLGRAARHRRDFWLLAGDLLRLRRHTNGLIGTHLIPACLDHGIPEVRAAGLLAVMGMFDLVGTTASGWLTDRWDSRRLLFTYYVLRGLSLIFLPDALARRRRRAQRCSASSTASTGSRPCRRP